MTSFTKNSANPTVDLTEEAIDAFAARVRVALGDLPKSDVAELTEGLEASLAEQAADAGPGAALPHEGDALAYADELREAAGLPVGEAARPTAKQPSVFAVLAERFGELRAGVSERVRANPALSSVLDFLIVLQPAWWVLRAVVACLVVSAVTDGSAWNFYQPVPQNPGQWLVLFGAIILSVQWGRGKWMPWRWMPVVRSLVSALLFVIVLVAAPTVVPQWGYAGYDDTYSQGYEDGLSREGQESANEYGIGMLMNGEPVSNIFAYDSDGKPLTEVQLFDQTGRPLLTVADPSAQRYLEEIPKANVATTNNLVPRPAGSGANLWNVFPLKSVAYGKITWEEDPADPGALYPLIDYSGTEAVTPPNATVYPLLPLGGEKVDDKKSDDKPPTN